MLCPFPGMDPYIERPGRWRGFHNRLVTFIAGALQPMLRPKYVAEVDERLFVMESDRSIYPDVSILKTKPRGRRDRGGSQPGLLDVDTPALLDLGEEIREPVITIVDPSAPNRVITGIEVLSPENKKPGDGRRSYLKKREEFWGGGTNLVEIDLLREGDPTVRVPVERVERLGPWHYLVVVTRHSPPRHEVYRIPLQSRLPRIAIPLKGKDEAATLDLQAAFTRCWDEGPYPELLDYDKPPPGRLKPEDVKWCVKQLRDAGMRNGR